MGFTVNVGSANGGCCACENQDGCDCFDGNSCAMECRSKSGTADVCGFPEFTDPSTPPKRYKRRETRGEIYLGKFTTEGCGDAAPCSPDLGSTYAVSGHGAVDATGFPVDVDWGGTGHFGDWDGSTWRFITDSVTSSPAFDIRFKRDGIVSGFRVGACQEASFSLEINIVAFVVIPGSSRTLTAPPQPPLVESIRDTWHVDEDYSAALTHVPPECDSSVVSSSSRHSGIAPFPLTSGGDAVDPHSGDLPIEHPIDDAYPGVTEITEETASHRRWEGDEICAAEADGDGYFRKYSGEVDVDLSNEDTDSDAMERAKAVIADWAPCVPLCQSCPAFMSLRAGDATTLGFRSTQVRTHLTASIIGHSYKFTFRYYRRVLGTGGPWLFFALDEFTLTITTTEEALSLFSDWHDVPNEPGFETRAQFCGLEDVTLL